MAQDLQRVESLRLKLEDNVQRLQRTLQQWRTWEAEYDALREEVNALPENATSEDVRRMASDFGGEVVKHNDIEELVGSAKDIKRSRGQIAALISRRIDWVQQNCKSASKQLESAQLQLGGDENVALAGGGRTVPTADIIEQLDDDENVVSGKLAKPGEHAEDIANMLRKAGVTDGQDSSTNNADMTPLENRGHERNETSPPSKESAMPDVHSHERSAKTVRFAPDVTNSSEEIQRLKNPLTPHEELKVEDTDIKQIVNGSFDPREKVWQIGDDDRPIDFHSPHVPVDESPEDAAMRRQMLQYNMQEVGAVVAELDLEEDDSEGFSSEEDELELDSATDDEDKYGRTTTRVISDEYRQKMLDMERRLNAQMMQNVGPEYTTATENDARAKQTGVPTAMQQNDDNLHKLEPPKESRDTKSVRFAGNLDIAPFTEHDARPDEANSQHNDAVANTIIERTNTVPVNGNTRDSTGQHSISKQDAVPPREASNTLSSSIVERPPQDTTTGPGKKVSRFKASRSRQ